MATERQTALARENFEVLCKTLDAEGIKYEKNDEKFTIQTGIRGKNSDILMAIKLTEDFSVVSIFCPVNIEVPENYRAECAIAVSRINFAMLDGSYDFDPKGGALIYRITTCYEESVLNEETFRYLIFTALQTSDEYHAVLKTVVEKAMTPDQIINFID